ncbi:MAG: TonB family protein [Verrucomicrobiae bacterium]|nr:TonB family protein [Verrucomicrobiae bacterium]
MNHALSHPVQFGIQTGENNLEIELTAAPAAADQTDAGKATPAVIEPSSSIPPEAEKTPTISAVEDHASAVEEAVEEVWKKPAAHSRLASPAVRQAVTSSRPDVAGDGSSPAPGRDATTLRSSGGAQTMAKPDYLHNPAPPYPEAARQRKQQGVVRLHVEVDEKGHAAAVRLSASSGFPLLDESALRTVRGWKFQPARMGSLAIASQVEIPIRFQLR